MRNTKQRGLVLEVINHSYHHPTAYQVYQKCIERLPNISLGTVYRNLNTLVELGEIQKLDIPGEVTRYDKNENHSHFVCVKCGHIIDLDSSEETYPQRIDKNLVLKCRICYEGICYDCLGKEEDIDGIKGK